MSDKKLPQEPNISGQRRRTPRVVTVGGRQYEIDGIPFGTVPAWQLIKQSGQFMTSERFASLPEADQHELFAHVQQYVRELSHDPVPSLTGAKRTPVGSGEGFDNNFDDGRGSRGVPSYVEDGYVEDGYQQRIVPEVTGHIDEEDANTLDFVRLEVDALGGWSTVDELKSLKKQNPTGVSEIYHLLYEIANHTRSNFVPHSVFSTSVGDIHWLTHARIGVFYRHIEDGISVLLCHSEGLSPNLLVGIAAARATQVLSRKHALDDVTPENVEQRPAAYRFGIRGEKLDVLPEPPEPEDRQFAVDTYEELIAKARELLDRLKRTNSAARVCNDVERLLSALGTSFDELRPGVLLSRARSIEADRAAFDTDEARAELFADAFAMIDDTLQSLRDLLAVFPIVRRIEAEKLALNLDRNPEAVPVIRERMEEIQQGAEHLQAATEQAIRALGQNDAAIEDATDPVLRTTLVADKLLVMRNFLSAAAATVGKELGEVAGPSWAAVKLELPKGIGAVARVAPFMGIVAFVGWAWGPVAGLAAAVPALKPIFDVFSKVAEADKPTGVEPKPTAKKPSRVRKKPSK
jgi:hypothetical protein